MEDISSMFLKCLAWQFEETMDTLNCPYHYFCESQRIANYPPFVDILVIILITVSYLSTLVVLLINISRNRRKKPAISKRRYFTASGPISLPLFILALAEGRRIGAVLPTPIAGPAILQLVLVSALSLEDETVLFRVSTAFGVLHAGLRLDAVLLPYYTGLEALTSSKFSGECATCVCRREPLVVGGAVWSFRGWSAATFSVVGALCFGKIVVVKSLLEGLGLVLLSYDCVFLIKNSPPERLVLCVAIFGGIFVLIFLHGVKMLCCLIVRFERKDIIIV